MAASASLTQGSSTVRLVVVTGGHEFDPSFWEIFKNQSGWKVERRANEPNRRLHRLRPSHRGGLRCGATL